MKLHEEEEIEGYLENKVGSKDEQLEGAKRKCSFPISNTTHPHNSCLSDLEEEFQKEVILKITKE